LHKFGKWKERITGLIKAIKKALREALKGRIPKKRLLQNLSLREYLESLSRVTSLECD